MAFGWLNAFHGGIVNQEIGGKGKRPRGAEGKGKAAPAGSKTEGAVLLVIDYRERNFARLILLLRGKLRSLTGLTLLRDLYT